MLFMLIVVVVKKEIVAQVRFHIYDTWGPVDSASSADYSPEGDFVVLFARHCQRLNILMVCFRDVAVH